MINRRSSAICRRAAVSVVAAAVALRAAHPGTVGANDFHVFSCENPYTRQGAPTDDWRYDVGSSGYGDGAGSSCSGGGGSISAYMDGGVGHNFGEGGAATFTAPGDLTIAAFNVWRYEAVGPSQPFAAPATNIAYQPGNVSVEGLGAQSLGCASKGTNQARLAPQNEVSVGNLSGITQLQETAFCGGAPGGPSQCPTSNAENGMSAEIDFYAADITLNDPTVPSGSDVGGPLISGNAHRQCRDLIHGLRHRRPGNLQRHDLRGRQPSRQPRARHKRRCLPGAGRTGRRTTCIRASAAVQGAGELDAHAEHEYARGWDAQRASHCRRCLGR